MRTIIIDQGGSDNKTLKALRKTIRLAQKQETLLVLDTMDRGAVVAELRRQCTNEGINFSRLRLTINVRLGEKILMDEYETTRKYRNVVIDLVNHKVCPKLDSIIAGSDLVVATVHDTAMVRKELERKFA